MTRPRLHAAIAGIGLMLAAMLLYPVVDAVGKILVGQMPVLQVVWARYVFQALLLLPLALWQQRRLFISVAAPKLQIIRSLFHLGAAIGFFQALVTVPMADTLAVFFVSPLVITALSPFLLQERIGVWRWSAVAVGFLGVLLIIRPGFDVVTAGILFALASGLAHAGFAITSRKLAGQGTPLVGTLVISLVGTVPLTAALPFIWQAPSPQQWLMMIGIGGLGAGCQWMVTMAYERAPASQLAPFAYSEMVSTCLLGLLLFGDSPDAVTWLGIAIVVASGIVIAWREGVRHGTRRKSP